MKDTYKAVLVMFVVPVLVTVGFSEACSNEVVAVLATGLTALSVAGWKWSKKD